MSSGRLYPFLKRFQSPGMYKSAIIPGTRTQELRTIFLKVVSTIGVKVKHSWGVALVRKKCDQPKDVVDLDTLLSGLEARSEVLMVDRLHAVRKERLVG
jgi:hypothetical protein